MEFTDEEKQLVLEYLKTFKRSPLSLKMLMCAYHGRFFPGDNFIALKSYLRVSIQYGRNSYALDLNKRLADAWNLDKQWKKVFFGFNRDIILNGTISDVENMVTEVHSNYIKRRNEIQTFTYRAE
jgi:hypothetical protein